MVQKNWVVAALALSLFLLSFIICWVIAIPDNKSQHSLGYLPINLPQILFLYCPKAAAASFFLFYLCIILVHFISSPINYFLLQATQLE
jgi:hypothetical protein